MITLNDELMQYVISIYRQLHQYPEIGFDLPMTVALVKRELDSMGISYTEQYGQGSVVAQFTTTPSLWIYLPKVFKILKM